MAVEMFEGFDTLTAAQLERLYTSSSINSTTTGFGGVGLALRLPNAGTNFTAPLTPRTEYFYGFHFESDNTSSNDVLLSIGTVGGGTLGSITLEGTGALNTTWGNTATGLIVANQWYNIQAHVVVDPTAGAFELRVDGTTVLNATGLNTGSTAINQITIFGVGLTLFGRTVDNFWAFNRLGSHSNNFPVGVLTVQPLYPASDGTYQDWTPDSGSTHYTQVDEAVADEDTSYVSATTIGDMDSYSIGSLSGVISQVHGVKVRGVAKKDDVPTKTLHVFLKSGSTIQEGSDVSVATTYTPTELYLNDDPHTSAQWTTSNVGAVEIGVKVIA